MCGIIGFYSPSAEKRHVDRIYDLFVQSRVRGLHAMGFAAVGMAHPNEQTTIAKCHTLLDLRSHLNFWKSFPPKYLIGHTRYSTSGGWTDQANNQPVSAPFFNSTLVFNGVISMKTKTEYEKEYKRRYSTENDGEILLDMVERGEDWRSFVARGKFSFSGIVLEKRVGEGARAYAIRNERRPAWFVFEKNGLYVASTRDIFLRAGFPEPKEIEPGRARSLEELYADG